MKHKGIICGILAAVCYGTNPFGALPLYEEGVNTASVLFYRFFMAVLMLAIMLTVQRKSFGVTKGELKVAIMGALEPLTAVAIGVMVFDESLTFRLAVGIVLILSAVLLIVIGKSFHLRTITHTLTGLVRKTWRWKPL